MFCRTFLKIRLGYHTRRWAYSRYFPCMLPSPPCGIFEDNLTHFEDHKLCPLSSLSFNPDWHDLFSKLFGNRHHPPLLKSTFAIGIVNSLNMNKKLESKRWYEERWNEQKNINTIFLFGVHILWLSGRGSCTHIQNSIMSKMEFLDP